MFPVLNLILLVFAFVCLCLASFGVNFPKCQIGWLGLAFWVLSVLLGGIK
jgi:hypothetical protein